MNSKPGAVEVKTPPSIKIPIYSESKAVFKMFDLEGVLVRERYKTFWILLSHCVEAVKQIRGAVPATCIDFELPTFLKLKIYQDVNSLYSVSKYREVLECFGIETVETSNGENFYVVILSELVKFAKKKNLAEDTMTVIKVPEKLTFKKEVNEDRYPTEIANFVGAVYEKSFKMSTSGHVSFVKKE